jgi:hypothetical protein
VPKQIPGGRRQRYYLYLAPALSLAAAGCVVIAILATYSVFGVDQAPTTLHDTPGTLAYNIVLASALALACFLAVPHTSRRFGLGLIGGAGVVFPLLLIGDIGSMLRSGPEWTDSYVAPRAGFYWDLSAAVLSVAAGVAAVLALRAGGQVRLAAQRATPAWAVLGVATSVAWILGTWRPWEQNILSYSVNGQAHTIPYNACCSLSSSPGQEVVEALAVTVAVAGLSIIAACLTSQAAAAGSLLAASLYTGATAVPMLFRRAATLDQLAPGLNTTVDQLQQDAASVQLHILSGVWIAAGASLALLLLALARGLAAGPRPAPAQAITALPPQAAGSAL